MNHPSKFDHVLAPTKHMLARIPHVLAPTKHVLAPTKHVLAPTKHVLTSNSYHPSGTISKCISASEELRHDITDYHQGVQNSQRVVPREC
jgi:hypothetical protein